MRKVDCSKPKQQAPGDQGFILPLIIIAGLIVGAGLMALMARSFGSLVGSIRHGQNQEAREAAESGLAVILKELNTNYPYLLINDCQITATSGTPFCTGWSTDIAAGGNFEYITSVCPSTTTPPQTLFTKLSANLPGSRGSYRLINYNFSGDQHQGGTALIRVEGKSIYGSGTAPNTKAAAYIQQEVNITPKTCSGAQGGYPGILGETIDLGNQDVIGEINGNLVCTTCDPNQSQAELENAIDLKNRGVVDGQIFGGQLALPDPPQFPGFPSDYAATPCTPSTCKIEGSTTLTAGQTNGGRCFTESSTNITHCKVDSISLSGGDVLSISTSGAGSPSPSIRLYVTGNLTTSGNSGIVHSGDPSNLSIFGLPRSESSSCTQQVLVGGTSQSLNAYIYMPDACGGINGGGSATPNIRGSMWLRHYGASSSNAGTIEVPDDMGSKVCIKFGINFCVGIREYAARGANRWTLLTKPS
jgi:hypothetical protein